MNLDHLLNNISPKNIDTLYSQINTTLKNSAGKMTKNKKHFSTILNLLQKNLEPSLQKMFLQTWLQNQLSFKKEQVLRVINFLNNNPGLDSQTTMQTAAFLARNNLLLLPGLLENIMTYLDQNQNITQTLNSLLQEQQNSEQNLTTDNPEQNINHTDQDNSEIVNNSIDENLEVALKNITINLGETPENIQQKIENYSQLLKQLLTLQNNDQNEGSGKKELLFSQLQAQQAVNAPDLKQELNLLLFVELPVLFNENKPATPLYLELFQEKNSAQQTEEKEDTYKLCFQIELENIGLLQAAIEIKNQKIKPHFATSTKTGQLLIKENIDLLYTKLNNLGYQVLPPVYTHSEQQEKQTEPGFPQININQNKDSQPDTYRPLDYFI